MSLKSILRIGLAAGLALPVLAVGGFLALRDTTWFEPRTAGGPPTMRLLTAEQYRSSIWQVFGEDVDLSAAYFPTLPRKAGLIALGSTEVAMTPGALEAFQRTARDVAAQVVDVSRRDKILPCRPKAADRADPGCAAVIMDQAGRLLFRRPLSVDERQRFVDIATLVAGQRGDFYEGVAYGLTGMMTSPKFLYVAETAEPDPKAPGRLRLDAYSKASRLSLFLWNTAPDDELLKAAAAGDLHSHEGVERQVQRMLASPRAYDGVRAFFGDLLRLQDFESVTKDSEIYPAFTTDVSAALHEQTLQQVVDHLVVREQDYRKLFTTNRTFVNRALGPLYRTPVPVEAASDQWLPYTGDAKQQAGLLTSVSFLASHSHPGRSSPTLRGKAVREIFLCQRVPDPPPTVDFTKFEDLTGKQTARARLDAHARDPACAGCHKLTDPIGLALENYDGAGQFRTAENGAAIDVSGDLDGRPFKGVAEVGRLMSKHPALTPCLTRRLVAYGVGHDPGAGEAAWLDWTVRRFKGEGYRFPRLMRDIATSRAFFAVSAAAGSGAATPSIPANGSAS